MEERKLQTKEITADAKQLFKEGNNKQKTFEALVEKYGYAKDVADVLKNIPSAEAVDKYGGWNTLLLILMIITSSVVILTSLSIGSIIWYSLLTYAVAKKLVKYYVWVSILSGLGLAGNTVFVLMSGADPLLTWISIAILVILFLPILIISIYLQKKLCPPPSEEKEIYTNSEGDQRMRIIYQFAE